MKILIKAFLRGLVTILPLFLTIYLCWWLISSLESLLQQGVLYVLPEEYYVPGIGLLVVIVLIVVLGFVLRYTFLDSVFSLFERVILSFPLVSTIYGGIKDFFDFFSEDNKSFSSVVVFTLDDSPVQYLGLITSETPSEFVGDVVGDKVAVYVPMSYQIGGFTLFVPKENVKEVECNVPDALRYILTAGVSSSSKKTVVG